MDSFTHLPPAYVPDDAADFFASLTLAARSSADVGAFYRALGQTLRLATEQKTAFNALTLGGLFAKIDYLCKEYRIPWALRTAVNTARVNVARLGRGSKTSWAADLQAVSEFIALVYAVEVPADLRAFFPAKSTTEAAAAAAPSTSAPSSSYYIRASVVSWTPDYVIVRTEDADRLRLLLNVASGDWTYLTKLLHEGAQLNIIRPRFSNASAVPAALTTDASDVDAAIPEVTAELIIYEPDYLVDVTSVARCFVEYTDSPFVHLLHKLAPFSQSVPILLGNLAGQILDDEVHGKTGAAASAACVDAFLRANALTLLALEDSGKLDLPQFLADADAQRTNIHTALHDGLAQSVGSYNAANVMLEPSFVSEMLGLQGRMDFLQLDHRVLIEQKSGKCGYNRKDPNSLHHTTPHYVQMLLYMAILRYNFHEQHRRTDGNLHSFLLYSKYAKPLLGLGPAPTLLFDAIRMRNGIVFYEEYYCKGGARLLERMTADRLKRFNVNERFWNDYLRPPLDNVLNPIHAASPLERDYCFRMLQFVATEHRISKVGNNTAQANCYASKWFLSLAEKQESGEIYANLTLADATTDHLTLTFSEDFSADTTNFRLGDVVIVYPYDADGEPDCRQTMVHRGTLVEISADGLLVKLRAPQSDPRVFTLHAHRPWAVEHDSLESSSSALYSAIHSFFSAPAHRRDLLMLQRPARVEATPVRGEYGAFADLAQRVKSARDFFLIIGPPGTGKTSYGMLYTLREQLLEPDTNVLLLSYTNRAVDEICSKLLEDGIDFIRIGNPHNCEPAYHPFLLDNRLAALSDDSLSTSAVLAATRQLIASTRVFVGTTSTMSAQHALFQLKRFDLAIIDEASQILEPHLLGLLSERHGEDCAIGKFVMIGDHKQLPAVVQQSAEQSAVSEPSLHAIGLTDCRSSLFERLLRRYGNDPAVMFMLRRQGRMHRDIAAFASRYFYEGLLDVVPLPHQVEEGSERLVFIPAESPASAGLDVGNDKVNVVEARIIASLVKRIATEHPDESIGVIVPYRNQISAIRSLLPEALRNIAIDTVERYQGSQRDHIIYGFTIQKHYQLAFLTSNVFVENGFPIDRKLNVALTRARKHLYIVGNRALLAQNQTFARLMAFAENGPK